MADIPVQCVPVEWEETPFYGPSVANGGANDALGSSSALRPRSQRCMYTPAVPAPMSDASVTIDDEEVGLVDQLCYLDDMLSCDGGAERRSGLQQRGRSGGKSVASSTTGMSLSQAEVAYIMPALGQSFYLGKKRAV